MEKQVPINPFTASYLYCLFAFLYHVIPCGFLEPQKTQHHVNSDA